MDSSLKNLAARYHHRYGDDIRSPAAVRQLYDKYVYRREVSIIDAAAATTALGTILYADQIDQSAITPQMWEAFGEAFPNRSIEDLEHLSPEEIKGWLSPWKGKLFEVDVRDRLNAGEIVGDIRLGPGHVAVLAESANQPGWDLQIINDTDRTIVDALQLKATDSMSYVKNALERYPDIDILATDEVASRMPSLVMNSGISDAQLEQQIESPVEALLDSPLEEFAEHILPGLPFVIITSTQGVKVLLGKQSFRTAMDTIIDRGVKSGAAMGVGLLVSATGAGIISLPAAFATRLGIDRFKINMGLRRRLESDLGSIQSLREGA